MPSRSVLLPLDAAGTTAVEYALIATLISIVAFALMVSIGASVSGFFGSVGNAL